MIPFNYHHLYYFYTVAKMGSISRACGELRLAQPTLSAQIKQLENFLNVKLFEREGKRLVLTDEGRSILFYAAEIFDTGKELMDRLGDLSPKGSLRIQIGVSNSVPKACSNALLKFIIRTEPRVHITVHEDSTEKMAEALQTHVLDLVLTDIPYRPSVEQNIENHLVGKIPIVFCAHPSLAKKYKKIPKDLNGAPLILPTAHSGIYHAVQEYFVTHRITPNIIAEIQDVELVRRLVLDGVGIAPLNRFTITAAPGREGLTVLDHQKKQHIYDTVYLLIKKRKKHNTLIPPILERFKLGA